MTGRNFLDRDGLREEVAKFAAAGAGVRQIAESTGIARRTVSALLREAGVAVRRGGSARLPVTVDIQRAVACAQPAESKSYHSILALMSAPQTTKIATQLRFDRYVDKTDYCWLWTGARDSSGYGNFNLFGTAVGAHKIAWVLTHGKLVETDEVLHRCDVPACVRASDHLFIGNQKTNVLDAIAKNRWAGGEKLSKEQRATIATRYAAGESVFALAMEYAIAPEYVRHIGRRVGVHRRGPNKPRRVLQEADVVRMRKLYVAGDSVLTICQQFNVTAGAARRALTGQTFSHLPDYVKIRPTQKLSDVEVAELRKMYTDEGASIPTLSTDYNVSRSLIHMIVSGKIRS